MPDCDDRLGSALRQIVTALRQTFLWSYVSVWSTGWVVEFLRDGVISRIGFPHVRKG